jgi:hypothetical protein
MSPRLAAALALALASCAGDCRGPSRDRPGEQPAPGPAPAPLAERDAGHASTSALLGDLPGAEPRWHVTLPGRPGAASVAHATGPVIAPGTDAGHTLVLVASSAVGVVAIAAETGDVRWQHAGEDAPGVPVIAGGESGEDNEDNEDNEIWLPGRCAHRGEEAQALVEATARPDEYVLGCVDIVERTGAVRERVWLRVAAGVLHDSAPRRSHALGRHGENLLWAHGVDLLELSMPGGRVVAHQRVLPAERMDADATGTAITGWIDDGPQRIVATTTGLAAFAACPVGGACAPAWHLPWPRAVGVTGPVMANGLWGEANRSWAWVRDQTLEAGARERIAWTAEGFHAYAPGSLMRTEAGMLLAFQMGTAGIQPVRVDPRDGRVVEEGAPVRGAQVLVAAPWGRGVAAVVRLDASLRHDAVIAWGESLRVRGAWPLPEPARRRIVPVGLAAVPGDEGGVVVFYDGRFAAHLPFAAQ